MFISKYRLHYNGIVFRYDTKDEAMEVLHYLIEKGADPKNIFVEYETWEVR